MNFYSICDCKLEPYIENGKVKHYSIMSGKEHVGTLRFCPDLEEWKLSLQQVNVTYGFMAKIWECLFDELINVSER